MEESTGGDQVSRKIIILDDFDKNHDLLDSTKTRPTIRGRHVRCSGDKLLLTGWKIPTSDPQLDKNKSEGGVSDVVNKGTRYFLPEEGVKSWESGVIDVKSVSNTKVSTVWEGHVQPPKNVYVSHNSIWTVDPDEPILEENIKQYDKTRRLFWILFLAASLAASLLLACIYSWVFVFKDGKLANATMDNLKLLPTKEENKRNLRDAYDIHALIMTTAVFVNIGSSIVVYRLFPHSSIKVIRCIHALLGFVAAVGSGSGLYFSYSGRNFQKEAVPFGVHATIGYITIGLIQLQFLAGFILFLLPCASFSLRVKLIPIHKFFGSFIFMLQVTTVVTGIIMMAKIMIPLNLHVKYPTKSIVLSMVGISAVLFAILSTILISDHRFRRRDRPVRNVTEEENITEFVNSGMAGRGDEDQDDGISDRIIGENFEKNKNN